MMMVEVVAALGWLQWQMTAVVVVVQLAKSFEELCDYNGCFTSTISFTHQKKPMESWLISIISSGNRVCDNVVKLPQVINQVPDSGVSYVLNHYIEDR